MARRIRIECEQRTALGKPLTDQRSGVNAFFNRGEDAIFELALFQDRRMLQRSEVATLTFKLFDSTDTELLTTTFDTTNMSSRLTAAQWRNGSACLIQIRLFPTDSGALPAGTLTLRVSAMIAGISSIFASGLIESVTVPGLLTLVPDPPNPPEYYTKIESDARYDLLGSGTAALDGVEELQDFLGFTPGDDPAKFLTYETQSLATDEKAVARANINAAVNGGAVSIIGESSGTANANAIPNGAEAMVISVEPTSNPVIELRTPSLAIGVRYLLKIQQGFRAKWTSDYIFPPNALTFGNSSGAFAKETWHPDLDEGFDLFELLYDGGSTMVKRFRQAALPPTVIDFHTEAPFVVHNGSAYTIRTDRNARSSITATAGTVTYAAMAGSSFKGFGYDGASTRDAFVIDQPVISQGFAVAMVFTATASSSQRIMFISAALGIQIVADTDGMRLQATGAASGTGVLIATSYSAKPIAFVAVIRRASGGAFVVTTDPGGGGQTGSFTPTAYSSAQAVLGSEAGGFTKALACVVARCQIYRSGLSPDQARAVLDSLTEYYQLG